MWNMGNQQTDLSSSGSLLPGLQSMHIVVIGLDGAGKTSLLYRLKLQEFMDTTPTKGFNMERIRLSGPRGGGLFQVWDVGGQEKLRPLWKSYTRRTDGLVFVVDAAGAERVDEARVELHRVARSPENQGVPILVLANKQDLQGAMTPAQVEKALGVHELSPSLLHHTQACSAVDGEGLQQGLELLHEMILKRRRSQRQSRRKR